MIANQLGQLPAGTRGWVVDQEGIVLYHPTRESGTRLDAGETPDPAFMRFVEGLRRGTAERGEYLPSGGGSASTMATAATIRMSSGPLSVVLETSEELVHGYLREFHSNTILGVALSASAVFGSLCLGLVLLLRTNRDLVREADTRRRAEERHRESEEHFRLLIEFSPVAMGIVDRADNFVYLNRKFTETLGYDLAATPDVAHWMRAAYPDQQYRREMDARWKRCRERGGGIDVASTPGEGTTFTIYLPRHQEGQADPSEELAVESAPEALGRGETILIAEDDPLVRETTVQTLTAAGYRIQVAADGEEVVRIYRALGGNVDLLLLDMVMPKKSGKDAYDEIRSRWGNVKVLFLSGYAPDLVYQEGMTGAAPPLLKKPVSRRALLEKVRELLEQGPQKPA